MVSHESKSSPYIPNRPRLEKFESSQTYSGIHCVEITLGHARAIPPKRCAAQHHDSDVLISLEFGLSSRRQYPRPQTDMSFKSLSEGCEQHLDVIHLPTLPSNLRIFSPVHLQRKGQTLTDR